MHKHKVPFQPKKHNYFDFAEKTPAKAKQRRSNEHIMTPIHLTWRKSGRGVKTRVETTSSTENRVDALALKADEGRGDRRNVPGELHASHEPGESEWGNPSRVMSGDRLLNP